MKKFLLWILMILFLLSAIVFAIWAIQAAWLTTFVTDAQIHDLSMRFYTRSLLAVLLFVLSVVVGYCASKLKSKEGE